MSPPPDVIPLSTLGVLRIGGADARSFLQGQLSNDLQRLSAQHSLLAGYHNPQGRTLALLRLLAYGDELLALLPTELIDTVRTRLAKFVLRAKVTLRDDSSAWQLGARLGADAAPGSVQPEGGALRLGLAGRRELWLAAAPGAPAPGGDAREWELARLAAGEPQVWRATSEQFVAQMLNLDLLDAIAFDKGCYTGQEVIARAHYRGRVKRRLQRFRSHARLTLTPGAAGKLADGRSFRVVDAVVLSDGRCEFLAVAPLAGAEADAEPLPVGAGVALEAEALPLPYALP